jgi:hypothetical protein
MLRIIPLGCSVSIDLGESPEWLLLAMVVGRKLHKAWLTLRGKSFVSVINKIKFED